MPQEIRVVQCFKCFMYQVDIVKKAKLWSCKLCGAKQSVVREFFRGSGAACRQKAQELNFEKYERAEKESANILKLNNEDIYFDTIVQIDGQQQTAVPNVNINQFSAAELPDDENASNLKIPSQSKSQQQKVEDESHTASFDGTKFSNNAKVSKWTNFL